MEPWIQLHNGKAFYPWSPKSSDFDLETIAVSLSRIPRFLGHTKEFYSVAQHSIDCLLDYPFDSQLKGFDTGMKDRIDMCKAILFHDAHEAYAFGDVPAPVKKYVTDHYTEDYSDSIIDNTNNCIDAWIAEWLGINKLLFYSPAVKLVDQIALATEARDLMLPQAQPWNLSHEPRERKIICFSERVACENFIELANELGVK